MGFNRIVAVSLNWSVALLLMPSAFAAPIAAPPVAAVRPVTTDYFGTQVIDPYRYFEDLSSPEVQAWAKAQATYADAVLASIPGRDALLARIRELDAAAPAAIDNLRRLPNNVLFYDKRAGDDNQFKVYVRNGAAAEKLLVDPDAIAKATGKPHAVNFLEPSPKGRYLAYGISEGGSEMATIHVLNVASGQEIGTPIERTENAGVHWADDESGFFYNQLKTLGPTSADTEKFRDSSLYFHAMAAKGSDTLVWNDTHVHGMPLTPDQSPFVTAVPGTPYAIAIPQNGVQNEFRIYLGKLANARTAKSTWTKLVDATDDVTSFAAHGNDLYLLTHKDASHFKVLRIDLAHPSLAKAELVVPATDEVIVDIESANDGLYVQTRHGSNSRLYRLAYTRGAKMEPIALPLDGSIAGLTTDWRVDGAMFQLGGWTQDTLLYAYSPKTSEVSDSGIIALSKFGKPDSITSTEVMVKGYDGVDVPLSIIHAKGIPLDGKNPVRLWGYGAYGITDDPGFLPNNLAWYERGGVLAVCHVRGGGAFGEDWHTGGKMLTKPNTWKDAIACGKYLVAEGYASAKTLTVNGGSAGGILAGRAMTEQPELFTAAVAQVGLEDPVRFEVGANGPGNTPEFGSVATADGFKGLYEMDSYLHVKDGVAYPAVLLTTGINDPRVDPWQLMKMTARLQAASSSKKPILLRIDYAGGHGIGSTREQAERERADMWAFMLWQSGVAGFQPLTAQ